MNKFDFNIGAQVYCKDKTCGKLHKVVVDSHTQQVTDLIVERGFLRKTERVLPVSAVERASDQYVYLSVGSDEIDDYPEYREVEFMEPVLYWDEAKQYKAMNTVCRPSTWNACMKNRTNIKIGVALSGGGVRGLAHLGVLQVLEEAEIPIDVVAGTSMGGIIAGLYAAGVSVQDIIAFGQQIGFMDLVSPDRRWRGLFGHKKVAALLTDLLDTNNVSFEDLKIPAAVIAADVETGELVILDKGPLIPALMATSAVPLIFSPVHHQGRWLVDGGVLNNLPVDVVRRMGADQVLGVNVPPNVNLSLDDGEEESELSLRGLFRLNNHIQDWKLPFLVAETSAGFTVRIINQTRLTLCPPDLLLEIHLPNVGLFADNDSAEIVEAGRQIATDHLAELVELKTNSLPPRWWRRLKSTLFRLQSAWTLLQETDYPLYPGGSSFVPMDASHI